MGLGRDLIIGNINRKRQLEDRKYKEGLLTQERERAEEQRGTMQNILGQRGQDAMTPTGFTPSGRPASVLSSPETAQFSGPMADVPTEYGGEMTPIFSEDKAATGMYSGDPYERAGAVAQLATYSPQAATATQGAISAADTGGAGGRALNAFNTFLDLDTGRAINAGYDASGAPVDTATGKRAKGRLVPYSDKAVETYQTGEAHGREDMYLQSAPPDDMYRRGYKVSDQGVPEIDPLTNRPVKLENAEKVLPRSASVSIKAVGELYDDAKEISRLMADPQVISVLSAAAEAGITAEIMEAGKNTWRKFLQSKGVAGSDDPRVIEVLARMQKMASTSRKEYAGTAVSAAELKALTPWLPDAGDSLKVMLGKMGVVEEEGKQQFKRYLDIYKDQANMSPFYEAFGMSRFDEGAPPVAGQGAPPAPAQDGVVNWSDL